MTTFIRVTPGVHDAATGTFSAPTTLAIPGSAIQVRGNPQRYTALGLVLTTMPTLFWAPTTYGDCPLPGDTVTWADVAYTVRDVEQIAPDGVVIAARVVIAT